MASLSTIPTELQCVILRLLDPVGLISASQTSHHFREIIKPARKHLVERLLQLECDEKEGGTIPLFNSTTNDLSPGWTTPEWKAMRWACSGCLRLLSDEYFDNHSILRLAYRKPVPGSPASDHFTTWDLAPKTSPFLPHIGREKRNQSEQYIEAKKVRRRYTIALSKRWNANAYAHRAEDTYHELLDCGWETFENMTVSEFIHLGPDEKEVIFKTEVEAIEAMRCGYKRHLRKCHECKYQSGQLKTTLKGSDGTVKTSYTTGRQYRIPTATDRYYPRFWEELTKKRPVNDPPSYAIYRAHVRDRFRTMYMVRCPYCEKWKEHRMFASGSERSTLLCKGPDGLSEREIDELRCYECYAKKYGSGPLGIVLMNDLKKILLQQASGLTYRLGHGFHCLLFEPELRRFPKQMREEIRSIAGEADNIAKSKKELLTGEYYTAEELGFLRERYEMWMEMRARVLNSKKAHLIRDREEGNSNNWFHIWTIMYTDLEDFYKWLLAVHDEVEKKPEKLAEWALHGSIREMPPVCTESIFERDQGMPI
ncbi:hypothetical protein N7509_013090 [Penicillium cosmopolitanum]|uniref:F-box domain-containing protein n=1 Tax=Penicillium cosmopolitanum TaxID=1131564 RepID=A0A9W9SFD3_9EURO|nr:uncharacterized protein N7509_013090 [Penicillium cosmopolitanum]KAJ5376204.1 hypothetical protein N7509_013090 [Penicillium cosmopolitanum]